ncbi:MAG TPA: hypothetical protein VJU83_03590 [Burkholderiales bacterium]|nr:hypothetical protein [Burkholderiales bacterium]
MNAIKQRWQMWADRLDGMSLRERVIVFFATTFILLFILKMLFSDPVTDRQKEIARDIAQKQVDARQIQDEVQKILGPRPDDPDNARQERIKELQAQVAALDARLAAKQRELVPPEEVTGMLEEMLRRERKLDLVGLRSLAPEPIFDEEKLTTAEDGTQTKTPRLQVYRHGVEVTVRGSYFDLLRYLDDLEQMPLRLFWRDVVIDGDDYPVITMKLSVYTLSLERSWVVV